MARIPRDAVHDGRTFLEPLCLWRVPLACACACAHGTFRGGVIWPDINPRMAYDAGPEVGWAATYRADRQEPGACGS